MCSLCMCMHVNVCGVSLCESESSVSPCVHSYVCNKDITYSTVRYSRKAHVRPWLHNDACLLA